MKNADTQNSTFANPSPETNASLAKELFFFNAIKNNFQVRHILADLVIIFAK